MTPRAYAILTFAAALAFALGPFITTFDGFDPNAYPIPQDRPPVQPEGYAFSIWGVIYLWLLVSTGYGLIRRADDTDWISTRPALLVSLVIGAIWLPVAEISPIWATLLIWMMLLTALIALQKSPNRDIWLLQAPIGLYAGWLTAASCVSIGLTGAGYGIVFTEIPWAVISIAIALGIATFVIRQGLHTPTYAIAVIWALIAVVSQNLPGPLLVAAIAGAGALAVATLHFVTKRQTGA